MSPLPCCCCYVCAHVCTCAYVDLGHRGCVLLAFSVQRKVEPVTALQGQCSLHRVPASEGSVAQNVPCSEPSVLLTLGVESPTVPAQSLARGPQGNGYLPGPSGGGEPTLSQLHTGSPCCTGATADSRDVPHGCRPSKWAGQPPGSVKARGCWAYPQLSRVSLELQTHTQRV